MPPDDGDDEGRERGELKKMLKSVCVHKEEEEEEK